MEAPTKAPTLEQHASADDALQREDPAAALAHSAAWRGALAHHPVSAPSSSHHLPVERDVQHRRSPLGTISAEVSRRLRGLFKTTPAVNFRDVEIASTIADGDGDELALGEDGDTGDADAATGAAAIAAPTNGGSGGGGAGAGLGGGSGGGAAAFAHATGSEGGSEGEGRPLSDANLQLPPGATAGASVRQRATYVRKSKLVIVMVGLPGRGKTFLCNKICSYFRWLGHETKHFNVGRYRRCQKAKDEVQDAAFFDQHNEAGLEARNRALTAALDDLMAWLRTDSAQIAVFDATNTTHARREYLRSKLHGVWQYLFVETICTDREVLERNYRNKMVYSPDYQGVDIDQAVNDFLERIKKYEEVYETINDRNLHYIKLIDMVTGRGSMDINRISGYIPGKLVFFLMQVCKAGISSTRRIWLTRHGESEYNQKGLIGGDSALSPMGERYARALPEVLGERVASLVEGQARGGGEATLSVACWTSTLRRTIQTARFLPFPKLRWKTLDEINAGVCDGQTYEQIAERFPAEYAARKADKLRYRYPAGESYMDVIQRVEPVIIELERERESVVVVAHQAVLRAVYAYFVSCDPQDIPRLEIPLHTLLELSPMPDGTMQVERFRVDVTAGMAPDAAAAAAAAVAGRSGGGGGDTAELLFASGLSPRSSVNSAAGLPPH